jgi:uncharacterized membrane protein YcaP (DUF421 family)
MKNIIKTLLKYWLEILIGGLILIFVQDIRWFLFYLLIVTLLILRLLIDFLKSQITIFRVENEIKLNVIIKKLNIPEEEIQKARDTMSDNLLDKDRKTLHEDLKKLGESNPESFYRKPLDGLSDTERGEKFIKSLG